MTKTLLSESERWLLLNALREYQDQSEGAGRAFAANAQLVSTEGNRRVAESFAVQARQCDVLAAKIEQADSIELEGIHE